jgi:hypothetical protein
MTSSESIELQNLSINFVDLTLPARGKKIDFVSSSNDTIRPILVQSTRLQRFRENGEERNARKAIEIPGISFHDSSELISPSPTTAATAVLEGGLAIVTRTVGLEYRRAGNSSPHIFLFSQKKGDQDLGSVDSRGWVRRGEQKWREREGRDVLGGCISFQTLIANI